MKYKLLLILLCLNTNAFCQNADKRSFFFQSKITHNLPSTTSITSGTELKSNNGISLELLHGNIEKVSVGFGIEYQTFRKYSKHSTRFISFFPLYVKFQRGLYTDDNISLFYGGKFGYNFCLLNNNYKKQYESKGGPHYGFFIGSIIFSNIFLESGFSINSGTLENKENHIENTIKCIQLSVGLGLLI